MEFSRIKALKGELSVPGDKSISHRAVMLGALANGQTEITNFLQGADCLATIQCFQKMGISVKNRGQTVTITGRGLHGLIAPKDVLHVGNSGTAIRLLAGILAAQSFSSSITGDASIEKRPMSRIITPLSQMGAKMESVRKNNCAPLKITGSKLHGIHYVSPVASAQVKSCILFAGLYASGSTSVTEPYVSRNHSELMLRHFGIDVQTKDTTVTLHPGASLKGQKVDVPGDISSAAFFIAAGLITPNSEILIKNVGINPTRDGILKVAKEMGGDITLLNKRSTAGEETADILVRTSSLHGVTIEGSMIPTLIDELPIIAVMACFADGRTVIKNAEELKVKESNRISVMVNHLSAMNADITETDDGMIICGGNPLMGASIDSRMDHRIAMSFAVAGINSDGITDIAGTEYVETSYPGFFSDLQALAQT